MTTAIAKRVIILAKEHFAIQTAINNPTASFVQNGADSLDMLEWAMLLEQEFTVEINDEHAGKIDTLKGSIDLMTELVTP